ncbi:complement receptor type 1-like isoform X2 [Mercenaria mercenaria]|uniref:complement receptor type 1-like isoform X2 n=1 Tax=Mercenaria mercenaria TaxID=6596 RepID=UPI00234E4EEE|nr:complement receptor type 1-like isoform X2 [Mercenaria mercenaria]
MEGTFFRIVLCYIAFSQMYLAAFCTSESLMFSRNQELDDKTCPTEDIIFTETAPSKIVCAYKCFENSGCRGFSYNTTDLMCTGCDKFYETETDLVDKLGSVFFVSIITCGMLSNPANSNVSQTGTTYLETATYVCNTGYEQTGGSSIRTCQADGTWSGSELVCTIEDCGPLSSPAGGTVHYTASTYLQTATYSCSTEYRQIGGDVSRTCHAGGVWNGTEIICQIYTCATLTDPSDGTVTATGNSFGNTATFSCDPGYDLIGSSLLTCGTGSWDDGAPTCTKKVDCGEPSVSDSHVVLGTVGGNTQSGAEVSFSCTPCTFFPDMEPAVITCQANATWSIPVCVYGPDVGRLPNGQLIPAGAIGCAAMFNNTCPSDSISESALLLDASTGSCYCDISCCYFENCCFDSTCDDDYDYWDYWNYYYRYYG